jgi:uncharacterized membrane protein HdeD (DUF308 family)
MAQNLALNWWTLALRGSFAVLVGLIAFFLPGVTLYALAILFGAYALLDGIVSLTTAMRTGVHGEHWWALIFEGLAGVGAAIVTMLWPTITLLALIYIIAAWAIMTGIFEIAAGIRLRKHIANEWLWILAGLASLVFGVMLFAWPMTGAVVVAWWIGGYALIFGILMLILAFRLRSWSGAGSSLHPQQI